MSKQHIGKVGAYYNGKMAGYRTHIRIIGDILYTARDETHEDGASVTCLIRKANVSHSRITGILRMLVSQGLLERTDNGGVAKYRISKTGKEFLKEYQSFRSFVDSFGLTI